MTTEIQMELQMSNVQTLVRDAIKDKMPDLFKELQMRGGLNEFVTEKAEEIQDAIHNREREIALAQGYNQLLQSDPMKAAGVMKMAGALAREEVFAEMLEFPQGETSQPRPDATTLSATPI